ncbi:hypothetical protein EJB05_31824, partial [Eragrostis curvula]
MLKATQHTTDSKAQPSFASGDDTKTIHTGVNASTLECPICSLPFEAAVFQASTFRDDQRKNGHAACPRDIYACAAMHEPISDIWCLPLENAIASMVVRARSPGMVKPKPK